MGAVVGFMVIGPLTAVVAGGAALYGNKFCQYFPSVYRTIFQSTNMCTDCFLYGISYL